MKQNSFYTWKQFSQDYYREKAMAKTVASNLIKDGVKPFSFLNLDLHFISDSPNKLINLKDFLNKHYSYSVVLSEDKELVIPYSDIEPHSNSKNPVTRWELHMETGEMPFTADIFIFLCLDMLKRGYEFDCYLDGYGALADKDNQNFLDPTSRDPNFYYQQALTYDKAKNLTGSFINYFIITKISPKDPSGHYSTACLKQMICDYNAALVDYDLSITIAPDYWSCLINRGTVKDDIKDYAGAIADYDTVINSEKSSKENKQRAYFNKGNTELNLGNKKNAWSNWKKAYSLGYKPALERIQKGHLIE